jgi:hypothetical protein
MGFYIEILIFGKQSIPINAEKLYNCELSEYYYLCETIKIYKFKTNKHELFDITNDRFEFVEKNIFSMFAHDPNDNYNLKIIVLLGINYEFSLHYRFGGIHTLEPNKMFIMNYDEQKHRQIVYDDVSIMSSNQFLILNINLPIHRMIVEYMNYYHRIDYGKNSIVIDEVNTQKYNEFLDVLKNPNSNAKSNSFTDIDKICINKIPHSYRYHYSIWVNLQRLVDHKYFWTDIESKIIYHGKALTMNNHIYNLEMLYSNCHCKQMYVNSDKLPLVLVQLTSPSKSQSQYEDKEN